MSCSSSNGRYFEKPICSKNSARSYMKMRFYSLPGTQGNLNKCTESWTNTNMPLGQCRKAGDQRHSLMFRWSELHRCSRGDSCLLSDDPYLLCECCSFYTGQSPDGERCNYLSRDTDEQFASKLQALVFTSLLSTEPSQLRPITWGRPSLLLLLLLMVGMSWSKNGLSSSVMLRKTQSTKFAQSLHWQVFSNKHRSFLRPPPSCCIWNSCLTLQLYSLFIQMYQTVFVVICIFLGDSWKKKKKT